MAMLDSFLDDFPLHPSLRIPPLLDPFPDFAAKSDLPSPLEPNARLNDGLDIDTAKLTGRRKALAEAKPIGEPAESSDLRPMQRGPRKRQKLQEYERIADFVQLPEPKTAAKREKPRPFQPVSVLNELHEPPPSAALFPPITPNDTVQEHSHGLSTLTLLENAPGEDYTSSATKKERQKGDSHPHKRVSQRPRTRWTALETEQLQKGVEIYGIGKWKKILNHPEFSFQPGRTPVDLKDHYRTKMKSQASKKPLGPKAQRGACSGSSTTESFWSSVTNARLSPSIAQPSPDSHLGTTATGAQPHQETISGSGNHRKGTWTDIEDENLEKGYKKYGFSWTRIAKDPELDLAHRTGPQVRDRFRTKFPALYGEDSRQHPRHVNGERKGKPHQSRNGSKSSDTTIGDGSINLSRSMDNSDCPRKPELERDSSRDNGSVSDNNDIAVEPIPTISPNRPSASASSAYNILDLLNSDVDGDRPSSELPLDAWDSNNTLPPLLWEEMATRPIFELE